MRYRQQLGNEVKPALDAAKRTFLSKPCDYSYTRPPAFPMERESPITMRYLRGENLRLLSLFILFAVVLAVFTIVRMNHLNNLANNGHWVCPRVIKHMLSDDAFMNESQTLAGNRLNLSAYDGFNELLYASPVIPAEFSFRYRLTQNACLSAIFDASESELWGIRVSANPQFPSLLFHCDAFGRFLDRKTLPLERAMPDRWSSISIDFDSDDVQLRENGRTLVIPLQRTPLPARVGFRSGFRGTTVDDVQIKDAATGTLYQDSFGGLRYLGRAFWYVLPRACASLLSFCIVGYFILRLWRKVLDHAIALTLCFIAGGVVYGVFYFFVLAQLYPAEEPVVGNAGFQDTTFRVNGERIRSEYNEIPDDGGPRVLFLGSSQVQGIGANEPLDEGYVGVLEKTLNSERNGKPPVHIINAAVSGFYLEKIIEFHRTYLADFAVDLTVISLSCNDSLKQEPPDQYARNLKVLAQEVFAHGSKLMFVVEASALEAYAEGFPLDREFCRAGAEIGIPVIDANAYLRDRYDTGFLFTDFVHPTSYGHYLLAQCLVDPIAQMLVKPDSYRRDVLP